MLSSLHDRAALEAEYGASSVTVAGLGLLARYGRTRAVRAAARAVRRRRALAALDAAPETPRGAAAGWLRSAGRRRRGARGATVRHGRSCARRALAAAALALESAAPLPG